MTNWIEGTLRMRGKIEDIIRFVNNGFHIYKYDFDARLYVICDSDIERSIELYDNSCEIDVKGAKYAYIEGTRMAFIADDFYLYGNIDEERVLLIPVKQAWGWFEDGWIDVAKKYNCDIRLIGWECGMEYEGELVIMRDGTCEYNERKYDDWDWESPCPLLGG